MAANASNGGPGLQKRCTVIKSGIGDKFDFAASWLHLVLKNYSLVYVSLLEK